MNATFDDISLDRWADDGGFTPDDDALLAETPFVWLTTPEAADLGIDFVEVSLGERRA